MTFYQRVGNKGHEAVCRHCGGGYVEAHDQNGRCQPKPTRLGLYGPDNPWNKWLEVHDPKRLEEAPAVIMDIDDELRDPGSKTE